MFKTKNDNYYVSNVVTGERFGPFKQYITAYKVCARLDDNYGAVVSEIERQRS